MKREEAERLLAEIDKPPMADKPQLDRICKTVDVGGAIMSIPDRASYADGGPEWVARYGDVESYRFAFANLLSSYSYLLSSDINLAEARRRLALMRNAFQESANG